MGSQTPNFFSVGVLDSIVWSQGSLLEAHRSQYYGTGFFEIRKRFIARLRARRQEARLKSASLIQGSGERLKGLQHRVFLDNGRFASERVQCSGSGLLLVLGFYGEVGMEKLGF